MRGYALFERRRFGSVFLDEGAVTGRGIRIGSTRARLLQAYGPRLTSRRNAYDPRAVDYFVRRAARRGGSCASTSSGDACGESRSETGRPLHGGLRLTRDGVTFVGLT